MNEITRTLNTLHGYPTFQVSSELFGRNLLGFENIFDNARINNTSYPPVNVIKKTDDEWIIEVACAGFSPDELEVTTVNGELVVTGSHNAPSDEGVVYMVRGLASRSFERQWTLAEHVRVDNADLKHGILRIHLVKEVPEEKRPNKINISTY